MVNEFKIFFNIPTTKLQAIMLATRFARGVMVIVAGYGHGDTSSNPGPDYISHSTNTLGEGMNPIILPPAMGK